MSVQALTAVMEYSEAQASARVVMFVLADHSDECGFSWPGVERLAHRSRIDPRNVQRHMAYLKELGELEVYPRKGRTNVYRILLPGLRDIDSEQEAKLKDWGVAELSPEPKAFSSLRTSSSLTARSLVTNGSGDETRIKSPPLAESPPPKKSWVAPSSDVSLTPDGYRSKSGRPVCPECGVDLRDGYCGWCQEQRVSA